MPLESPSVTNPSRPVFFPSFSLSVHCFGTLLSFFFSLQFEPCNIIFFLLILMFKVSVCNLVFDVQNCCREFVPLYTELRTACYVIFCCYDHFHHVLTYSYIVQSSNSIPNHELDFIFYFLFYFFVVVVIIITFTMY